MWPGQWQGVWSARALTWSPSWPWTHAPLHKLSCEPDGDGLSWGLSLTGSSVSCFRLQALQLTCDAEYVPFLKLPQRSFLQKFEMAREMAVETSRILSDTNHYALPGSHFWDITS
ncbi:unnamed protein product [Symbiodinium natans]|uniref:Uncharacterized protein n=1 Tax=Symbiodinium natans TaxID=878477 RepID=A0A812M5C2_9DINO|nr:unnamed protein product [Symbiodinium natans]